MPNLNEIEDLEPEFAPDQYSREEIEALLADVWPPRIFGNAGYHGYAPAVFQHGRGA